MDYQVKEDRSRRTFVPDNFIAVFDRNEIMKNETKVENSDVYYI